MNATLVKILAFILRKISSLKTWFFNPRYFGTDFINIKNIELGKGSRFSGGSRLYCNAQTGAIKVGRGVWAGRNVDLHTFDHQLISIGAGTSLQDNCKIIGDVEIGANSIFAPNVYISSGGHQFSFTPHQLIKQQDREHPVSSKKVIVGEDTWLGINVAIMPGLSIGRGAVVGANSVVTKNIPAYEIWAGVPAKKISNRLDYKLKSSLSAGNDEDFIYFDKGFNRSSSNELMELVEGCSSLVLKSEMHTLLKISFYNKTEKGSVKIKINDIDHTLDLVLGDNEKELALNASEEILKVDLISELRGIYVRSVRLEK